MKAILLHEETSSRIKPAAQTNYEIIFFWVFLIRLMYSNVT